MKSIAMKALFLGAALFGQSAGATTLSYEIAQYRHFEENTVAGAMEMTVTVNRGQKMKIDVKLLGAIPFALGERSYLQTAVRLGELTYRQIESLSLALEKAAFYSYFPEVFCPAVVRPGDGVRSLTVGIGRKPVLGSGSCGDEVIQPVNPGDGVLVGKLQAIMGSLALHTLEQQNLLQGTDSSAVVNRDAVLEDVAFEITQRPSNGTGGRIVLIREAVVTGRVMVGANPCLAKGVVASLDVFSDEVPGKVVFRAKTTSSLALHRPCSREYRPVYQGVAEFVELERSFKSEDVLIDHVDELNNRLTGADLEAL